MFKLLKRNKRFKQFNTFKGFKVKLSLFGWVFVAAFVDTLRFLLLYWLIGFPVANQKADVGIVRLQLLDLLVGSVALFVDTVMIPQELI